MNEKLNEEFIAPCGMNCRTCVAFFGYTLNGKKRKLSCSGCRPNDRQCAFIKKHCSELASKQIKYCFECTGFPCEKLTKLDSRYRDKYAISLITNLKNIQTRGIVEFLEKEQERWKCPNCGEIICVHTRKCYTCKEN